MGGFKTLQDAVIHFSDFENCKTVMMKLRWPDGVVKCPHCGSEKVIYLAKNRVWKCYGKHERPTFSLKTGTIFEDSPLQLSKWLPALWLVVNCNGPRSLPSILSRELPVGFSDSFRHLEGKVGMLACQWDRIHACIGKPSIPLEAERKNSIRRAPTKSVSGPSSRLILRG